MSDYSQHLDPLSIFLVKTGARGGDRVLFRYPYTMAIKRREIPPHCSEYSILRLSENAADLAAAAKALERERLTQANLVAFDNRSLANLFAVSPNLCGRKFELKVDSVRFVGHPRSILPDKDEEEWASPEWKKAVDEGKKKKKKREEIKTTTTTTTTTEAPEGATAITDKEDTDKKETGEKKKEEEEDDEEEEEEAVLNMFVVVFALSARTSYSVVKQYHDLAMDIAQAIRNEELRDGFLQREAKIMIRAQDEVAAMPPEERPTSPFSLVEVRSELARDLTRAFKDVKSTGMLETRFNGWSEVTFCLAQKVHKSVNSTLLVEPEQLDEIFDEIRPYHALLLLQSPEELVAELPLDYCSDIKRIAESALPTKSLSKLAMDTALDEQFVWREACNLVYWGKATIIFPLAGSNQYVLSPFVSNHTTTLLRDKFAEKFPGESLTYYLELLSLPSPVDQLLPPTANDDETKLLHRVLIWMLQHHLLMQLHKFVTLLINDDGEPTDLPDPRAEFEAGGVERPFFFPPKEMNTRANDRSAEGEEEEEEPEEEEEEEPEPVYDPDPSTWDGKYPPVVTCAEEEMAMGIMGEKLRGMTKEELLAPFSKSERAEILKINAASNLDDLRMFARLAPYFSNGYNLESIMYWENVRRYQVLIIVDKFRGILTVEEREDPFVSDYFRKFIKNP